MTIVGVGDRALAVLVAAETAEAATARVRGIAAAIDAATIAGVVDIVPSPDRVTVVYDPLRIASVTTIREAVAAAAAAAEEEAPPNTGKRMRPQGKSRPSKKQDDKGNRSARKPRYDQKSFPISKFQSCTISIFEIKFSQNLAKKT